MKNNTFNAPEDKSMVALAMPSSQTGYFQISRTSLKGTPTSNRLLSLYGREKGVCNISRCYRVITSKYPSNLNSLGQTNTETAVLPVLPLGK